MHHSIMQIPRRQSRHITNEIKEMVREISAKDNYDVVLVELGGTVGDIESQPFLEALRQLRNEEGSQNVMFVHDPKKKLEPVNPLVCCSKQDSAIMNPA